jgi:hypothetical protein
MIRSLCGGLALVVCSLSVLAAPRTAEDLSALPMRFVAHQEGPADNCGASCRLLVSASGMITADTPKDFENFARGRDLRGAILVLDSKGGSVLGAITLGRAVRALRMTTTVGRVKEVGRDPATRRIVLSPRAECQSMCPFVMLGGVRRVVPAEARVLVHQIWLGDRRDDAAAANYSAEDLVLVQRDIGKLVQYTVEMGGGAELLEVALRIPPWEPMRALSREELRRTKLDYTQDRTATTPGAPASSASSGVSGPAPALMIDRSRSETGGRGWLLAERDGRAALIRHHPLTIEGDKIGSFEVTLACGPSAGTFAVTYAESRRSPAEADSITLKQVDLWIEGKSAPLEIVSSAVKADPHELDTVASGTVSIDAVKSFADAAADSLTVRTVSSIDPNTMIRVGNSGLARAFPKLAAACDAVSAKAAKPDAHARLTPVRGESGRGP